MKVAKSSRRMAFALAAGLLGSLSWSGASYACSGDSPVISSVCAMAAVNLGGFNNTYLPANGAVLNVSQYQALYSLIGNTYGGSAPTTFALPDLQGRTIIGAGRNVATGTTYTVGQKGGNEAVTLSLQQLPAHTHALTATNIDFSKVTATTTLGTLAATVSGNLSLKAASTTTTNTPSGNALGTTATTSKIYSSDAPSVTMNAGSIDSSTLKVGLTGAPSTTLSGTATLIGNTAVTGSSLPVSVMQPYLALNYYIAVIGLYPSRD